MVEEIEGVVAEACLEDSFCDEALDDHVARICLQFGFAPEVIERWRDLPDPPDDVFSGAAEGLWQSSA